MYINNNYDSCVEHLYFPHLKIIGIIKKLKKDESFESYIQNIFTQIIKTWDYVIVVNDTDMC